MEIQKPTISSIGTETDSLALVHCWAGPFSPQPTLEQVVAENAVSKRDATVARLNLAWLDTLA